MVELTAEARQRILHDDPVGSARDGNAVEGLGRRRAGQSGGRADDFVKRAVHRAQAGAAGQHECSIDVEKHELGHD